MPMMALAVVERPEPLRPSSADDLALRPTSHVHAMQHMALAVEGVQPLIFSISARPSPPGGLGIGQRRAQVGFLHTRWLARTASGVSKAMTSP
jgi:hypothetical protein